jgi:hypothetical protein
LTEARTRRAVKRRRKRRRNLKTNDCPASTDGYDLFPALSSGYN